MLKEGPSAVKSPRNEGAKASLVPPIKIGCDVSDINLMLIIIELHCLVKDILLS